MGNDIKNLEKNVLTFPDIVKGIVIANDDQLYKGNQILLKIRDKQKEVNDVFDPMIKRAHEAHKEIIAQKKKFQVPLEEAEQYLKHQIAPYLAEKERIRREVEEKIRREREEAEKKARDEENRKLQEALEAEEEGRTEDAYKIIDEVKQKPSPAITPIPEKTKLEGTSLRTIWRWEMTDKDKIPREYLKVDEQKISAVVRALKGATRIPGIRAYSEDIVASRGSR